MQAGRRQEGARKDGGWEGGSKGRVGGRDGWREVGRDKGEAGSYDSRQGESVSV